ncbi:hypothetical protein [Parendozoicomonas sp. Alg238-R29]|uniref:hypothetical protein n=1 Tax=Parendozoicomonas sp. Alg238-R29 TaxID=2993446 RepID=UPI00248E719C|nr:hypothetical protein [Parendozoicomonas sp. Alg238-R29]
MISSIEKTANNLYKRPFQGSLLVIVYLCVALYSVSHSHNDSNTPETSFAPAFVELYQSLSLEDHAEHWHSDQHHSTTCKLFAQTSPVVYGVGTHVVLRPPQQVEVERTPLSAKTPTSRVTRAPPITVT